MNQPVFLYGTLCDPELYEIVAGEAFIATPATLGDFAVHWAEGETFPIPVLRPGTSTNGFILRPTDRARARLDFYELGFGYSLDVRSVTTADGDLRAAIYVPGSEWPKGAPWSLSDWQAKHGALSRLAAGEYIGLIASHSPEAAARAFPQIRMRAATALRARAASTPEPLTPKMAGREVVQEQRERPYTDYFAVQEDWIAFPTFEGGKSAIVKRASFLGGDAVTILPYDPATGNVLMVRQFRHGPYARGDGNPWTLEPAAGRIDAGETPEETAARELQEETGVTANSLHLAGRYYPSPGAYSEFLYSFVATADLSGTDGGVGGLENEAEDIMRHVMPLEDALALIDTGAANTGPLILSLSWLAINKERLS